MKNNESFYTWLRKNLERPGPIGDLARDAKSDECFPKNSRSYWTVYLHIDEHNASGLCLDAVNAAWLEYRGTRPWEEDGDKDTPDPETLDDRPGNEGFVYALHSFGNIYKIGKAKNLDNRIMQLGLIFPLPLTLKWSTYTIDRHWLERILHEKLSHRRLKGEWFRLDDSDFEYIDRICCTAENATDPTLDSVWSKDLQV